MAGKNAFQLLLDLGVDTASSRDNINNYIKGLKDLEKVKLELDITGGGSVDKTVNELQTRIKSLEKEIDTLNKSMSKVGQSFDGQSMVKDLDNVDKALKSTANTIDSVKNKGLASLNRDIISSMNDIEELYHYLDSNQIKFKINENSIGQVSKVVAQIKNEFGQLESLNITPKYFENTNSISGMGVTSTLEDTSTFKLNDSIQKSIDKLKDLQIQGALTADNIDKYMSQLNFAETNKDVEDITKEFTQLAKQISIMDNNTIAMQKFNAELEKMSKQGLISDSQKQNFINDANIVSSVKELQILQGKLQALGKDTSVMNTLNNAMENIAPTVDRLNNKLEVTVKKLGDNIDSTALSKIKQDLEEISNTKLNTIDEITRLNSQISNTEKAITQLTVAGNSTARFEDNLKKANDLLRDLERSGYSSETTLENFKKQLADIPTGDLAKVKTLLSGMNDEMDRITYDNSIVKALQNASTELNKVESQLEKTKRLYASTFDPNEARQAETQLKVISERLDELRSKALIDTSLIKTKDLDELSSAIKYVNEDVRDFNANATTAVRNSTGLIDALKTAFTKFPIWMIASTAFYGTIGAVKDLTTKVIELDTAMTNLIRVSNGEQFEFNTVLERAIDNTTELSGRLNDFMELVNEFSRTGKSIDESFDLANTTQMLMNISELQADQAVDSLTASMIAFNIAADDSARIADKLNEVDNNYSITTLDLSQSINKAANTAKTFGVTLDELIGQTTAIGAATRESGNIVGNSLKSIYARMTTNSSAIGALESIGISINDVEGNVKSATTIFDELYKKWGGLSDAQRQVTSVNVAGIYQLSRFNALMNNYKMSIDATATSLDSYGSAIQEQEKYNQSLEARINRLNTAWYGLADAAGNTVIYDSIVVLTSLLEKMANTGDYFGTTVIGLSSAMGLLAMPLSLLSGRFTAFTTGIIQNTAQQKLNTVSTTTLTGKMYALAAGTTAASTAFRTFLMTTGVGIGIAVLTGGLTLLINKLSEAKQEAEEFDNYLAKNVTALTDNKEEVNSLIESFQRLSSEKGSDIWNTEKEQEYLDVQNKLGELFPSIVDHVDSKGNSHLKSKDAINAEIEATNKLIEAENKLKIAQAEDNFKDVDKDIAKAEKKIAGLNKVLKLQKSQGYDDEDIAQTEYDIVKLEQVIADKSAEIRGNVSTLVEAFSTVGKEINKTVKDEMQGAFDSLDFSNMDATQLKDFASSFADIREVMSEAFEAEDSEKISSLNQELNNLMATTNDYNPTLSDLSIELETLKETAESATDVIIPMDESIADAGGSAESLAEKISDLSESIADLKTIEEQMAGVSQNHVDSSKDLIFMYEQLTALMGNYSDAELNELALKNKLSAEEKVVVQAMAQRKNVITQLSVLYPEYAKLQENAISLSQKQVDAMKEEQRANELLIEAYGLMAEGKLTAEQSATVAQAKETTNRINEIKKEIAALNDLVAQYEDTANAKLTAQEFVDKVENGEWIQHSASFVVPTKDGGLAGQVKNQIASKELDLSNYQKSLSGVNSQLDGIISSVNESTKSSKKSSSATKESVYITDKYKQALEDVNLAILKQQKLQDQYPKYTDKYRKALQDEIKLQKQKLNLIDTQTKALQKQISSGKIKQTGNVTTSTTTTTKAGSTSVSGFQGRLTSPQGWRTNPVTGLRQYHEGIDLASPKGTRLDSHVDGTVLKTGTNSVSGNYVKIKDNSGITHFFGHLDTIVAKMGEVITAGTKIGTIGSTGRSTGSHLHYQVSDANGKLLDAATYAKQARTGTVTTKGGTTTTSNGVVSSSTQSIDEAKSTLNSLQQDLINQQETIRQLEEAMIDSFIAYYENKQSIIEKDLSSQESRLNLTNKSDTKYNKILDYQLQLLGKKKKYYQEELLYAQEVIKKGNVSQAVLDNMNSTIVELEGSLRELNLEIQQFKLDRVVSEYDEAVRLSSELTDIEQSRLEVLNQSSPKYRSTLEAINKEYQDQKVATEQLVLSLHMLVDSGELVGETLADAKTKLNEAKVALIELEKQISNGNYEIIVNIQTQYEEKNDDLDFEILRERAFRENYVEGSINYQNSIKKETELLEQQAQAQLDLYKAQEKELQTLKLSAEDYKKVTESMEDAEIQYWSLKNSIKELTKQSEDSRKKLLEDLADEAINALKDYYSQRQEETNKAYDDELDTAQKRHDKIMEQYEDEMDLFRKNVEEKLKLIDRTEAERDYNMEMNELMEERNKIQSDIDELAIDDSREAKKKKKDLLKQLDDIDKQIAEARHDRDIDLQKEALNDQLELKEEEIDEKKELEDESYNAVVERINKEKEYWNQYYTDLLNDQRKFNQIREDIINGHLDKVMSEFEGYALELESTMYKLENTLGGTMQAVGTAIRQNVIDNLREAINTANEFTASQDANSSTNTDSLVTSDRDPNAGKANLTDGGSTEVSKNTGMSNADYKVLLAKYMREYSVKIAKNQNTVEALKAKGNSLAQQGRSQGSIISPNDTLSEAMSTLNSNQRLEFKNYVKSSASSYVSSDYLLNDILRWAASLDTGGMMNWTGAGIDGKGGKAIIAHPSEIMMNTSQVDELFESIKVTDSLSRNLLTASNQIGNILKSATTPTFSGGNIENRFQFDGDIYTENKDSLTDFFGEVGNMMRVQNGGWK